MPKKKLPPAAQGSKDAKKAKNEEERARKAKEKGAEDAASIEKDATWLYENGFTEAAFEAWREAAERGNAEAQDSLGGMYDEGEGTSQDREKAVEQWQLAAAQGHGGAHWSLGAHFGDEGNEEEEEKHYNAAAEIYHDAARTGDKEAQSMLGLMMRCRNGLGAAWLAALPAVQREVVVCLIAAAGDQEITDEADLFDDDGEHGKAELKTALRRSGIPLGDGGGKFVRASTGHYVHQFNAADLESGLAETRDAGAATRNFFLQWDALCSMLPWFSCELVFSRDSVSVAYATATGRDCVELRETKATPQQEWTQWSPPMKWSGTIADLRTRARAPRGFPGYGSDLDKNFLRLTHCHGIRCIDCLYPPGWENDETLARGWTPRRRWAIIWSPLNDASRPRFNPPGDPQRWREDGPNPGLFDSYWETHLAKFYDFACSAVAEAEGSYTFDEWRQLEIEFARGDQEQAFRVWQLLEKATPAELRECLDCCVYRPGPRPAASGLAAIICRCCATVRMAVALPTCGEGRKFLVWGHQICPRRCTERDFFFKCILGSAVALPRKVYARDDAHVAELTMRPSEPG